jgi:DNA polymerase-1
MQPHIYIFDVNSIFGRVFPHTNKRVMSGSVNSSDYIGDTPVYTLRETIRLIRKEINAVCNLGFPNTHIVMVCDAEGDNFRHRLYGKYKSGRPPKPLERKLQEGLMVDMLKAAGFPVLSINDCEADDVIGTLTSKLSLVNVMCTVFTGDKDLKSLCNDNVMMYNGKIKELINEANVIEQFGFSRNRILDFLALAGDSADSVPGVEGIADKSATELMSLFSFEDLMNNPDIILTSELKRKKSIHRRIVDGKEQALLSRKLVELKCDVALGMNFKDMKFTQPDHSLFLDGFFA